MLRALLEGQATGVRSLAERIAGRSLRASGDVTRLQECVAAIRTLTEKEFIVRREVAGGSLLIRITRSGRKAIGPERSLTNFGKLAMSLTAVWAVASLAGCATRSELPSHKPIQGMEYPTVTGMGQVRDPQTGELVFMPCNPCAKPTVKTPVAIVPPQPLKAPEPEPMMMRGNLVATLAESVAQPSAITAPKPVESRERTDRTPATQPDYVLFESASSRLDGNALAYLKRLATSNAGAANILVTGQTDSTGTPAGNERLALARARAVRAALIAGGIPAWKIKTSTCLSCFTSDNNTDEGKRQNRRAVIEIKKG